MKNDFKGFYSPNLEEMLKNPKTVFVFDTNVLTNLYRYKIKTRDSFFEIVEKIKERTWLPYHVVLEYQRNRLGVVKDEKNIFNDIKKYARDIEKSLETQNFKNMKLEQRLPDLFEKSNSLHKKIKKDLNKYLAESEKWNEKQPCVRSGDKIRYKLDELFKGNVGDKPKDQDTLDKLFKEGEKRYENLMPPGYEDKKEKSDNPPFSFSGLTYIPMYGDLIIWKQIIEKVKKDDIKHLVFVTDDAKEDWWYIISSNGKKSIGARAELREEIHNETEIKEFTILNSSDFLSYGKEHLSINVDEKSIDEAKDTFKNEQKKNNFWDKLASVNEQKKNNFWDKLASVNIHNKDDFFEYNYDEILETYDKNDLLEKEYTSILKSDLENLYEKNNLWENMYLINLKKDEKYLEEIEKDEKLLKKLRKNEKLLRYLEGLTKKNDK